MANLKDIDAALQVAFDAAKELEDNEALIKAIIKFLISNPEIGIAVLKQRNVRHREENSFIDGRISIKDELVLSYETVGWTYDSGLDHRPRNSNVIVRFKQEDRASITFPNYMAAMKFCQEYCLERGYFFLEENFKE